MTSTWDDYAAGWDDQPGVHEYADNAFASLVEVLQQQEMSLDHKTVLDFGCGTGLLSGRLAPHVAAIDAVDSSKAMVDVVVAKIAANGWQHVTAHRSLPLVESSTDNGSAYDLVVCSSVLGFVDDYQAMVSELGGRLKPGGVFVQWDWERDDNEEDSHGLTRGEMEQAISSAGLDVIKVDVGFSITIEDFLAEPLMAVGVRPR